ncbi:hypothetical protein EB796_011664 [Bugula neritina]|uniref:Uncharacterized protein n=1 Tax=Bugula neritina TaxID=10212 RepID=A0A7J7JUK2_BUGNE|nr:hypothetical protein EB796_011664 [Bugula neritina]
MDKELRENILKSAKQSYAPAELEPAAAFRCVSAAEAEEIGNRLYAGHRKKNSDGEPAAKNGQEVPQKRGRNTVGSSTRLHTNLPYSAKVRCSRNPVKFIGKHKYVNDIAQTQPHQY